MAAQWLQLLAVVVVVTVTHAQPNWTLKPVNTAARVNTSVGLYCEGDFGGNQWTRTVLNDAGQILQQQIYINLPGMNKSITEGLQHLYARNRSSPSDLIIKAANVETATDYTCTIGKDGLTDQIKVHFNALEKLKCNASRIPYPANDTQELTCSVNYYGVLKPRLVWHSLGVEKAAGIIEDTDNNGTPKLGDHRRLVSKLNITVNDRDEQAPFQCLLHFDSNDQTNPNWVMPTYTDGCELFSVLTHAQPNWTLKPVNTAARVNTTVGLYCEGDFGGNQWTRSILNDLGETLQQQIYINMPGMNTSIAENLQHLYARNRSSPSDLIIKVANVETATNYTCTIGKDGLTDQIKVHFDALEKLKCNASRIQYPANHTQELTCSVNYYGALKPRLVWHSLGVEHAGRIVVDTDNYGTPKLGDHRRLVSKLNITVNDRDEQAPFQCLLHFDSNDQTNPNWVMPTYTDDCELFSVSKYGNGGVPMSFNVWLLLCAIISLLTVRIC